MGVVAGNLQVTSGTFEALLENDKPSFVMETLLPVSASDFRVFGPERLRMGELWVSTRRMTSSHIDRETYKIPIDSDCRDVGVARPGDFVTLVKFKKMTIKLVTVNLADLLNSRLSACKQE